MRSPACRTPSFDHRNAEVFFRCHDECARRAHVIDEHRVGLITEQITFGAAQAFTRSKSAPSPITTRRLDGIAANASTISGMRLYGTMREAIR
jgi:hypothetical protein